MLCILELGFRKHIVEILISVVKLILNGDIWLLYTVIIQTLFYLFKSLCFIKGVALISLRVLLHCHHREVSLNFNGATMVVGGRDTFRSLRHRWEIVLQITVTLSYFILCIVVLKMLCIDSSREEVLHGVLLLHGLCQILLLYILHWDVKH